MSALNGINNQAAQNAGAVGHLREAHKARILRELDAVTHVIQTWQEEHPEDNFTNAIQVWAQNFKNSLRDSLNLGEVESLFVQELKNMICPEQNVDAHARIFPIDEHPIYDIRSHETFGAKAYIFYLLGSTRENREIGLQLVAFIERRASQNPLEPLFFKPHLVVKHMVEFLKKRNSFFYPEGIDEAYQRALSAPDQARENLSAIVNRLLSEDGSDLIESSDDEGLSTGLSEDDDIDFSFLEEQEDTARRTALMMHNVQANAAQLAADARQNATSRTFQSLQQGLLSAFSQAEQTADFALSSLAAAAADLEEEQEEDPFINLSGRIGRLDANLERIEEERQVRREQALQRLEEERDVVERNLEQAALGNHEAIEAIEEAITRILRPEIEASLRAFEQRDRRLEARLDRFEETANRQSTALEARISQVVQRAQAVNARISNHVHTIHELNSCIEGVSQDVNHLRKNIEETRRAVEELKERRENNTWGLVAQIGICIVASFAIGQMVYPTGNGGLGIVFSV